MRMNLGAAMLAVLALAATGCSNGGSDASSKPPVTQVAGKIYSSGNSYGLTYECAGSLSEIDVPQGESVNVNGSNISLTATDSDAVSRLEVTLSEGDSLPAIIVTGPDYVKRPDLYNQTVLQLGLSAGGSGSYVLDSRVYAENYTHQPIARVTLCIATTSSE